MGEVSHSNVRDVGNSLEGVKATFLAEGSACWVCVCVCLYEDLHALPELQVFVEIARLTGSASSTAATKCAGALESTHIWLHLLVENRCQCCQCAQVKGLRSQLCVPAYSGAWANAESVVKTTGTAVHRLVVASSLGVAMVLGLWCFSPGTFWKTRDTCRV